ncbi:EF-Tu/IF-2/RF-3 family GTPase [Streptomyces xanthophaeus]|uniref:EF-Tu/IF-2/RF-3 family GTPase n=1 Tax=Streptomyces xanthophaeus TaxID=67385 RepID=UPI0038683DD4|nr:EF-Tu/IF-2/RF-3 family GTPase [Streptomyces xanthophaeus]WST58351.1 EF-Tu/IF-2/RF-3 family GTPase [Streptomyces xanthophaeus]
MGGPTGQAVADSAEEPFLMAVEDVFLLQQGRAVMVTGRIERGLVRRGDLVEIVGSDGTVATPVTGIEQHPVRIGAASAGMNVGVLLDGAAADAVDRGQVLATPGSIRARGCFTADFILLSEEQGGVDVASGDRLLFHTRAAAVWGTVTLAGGVEVIRPLHGAEVVVALDEAVALEVGQSFAVRARGRAAGSGTVIRLPR